jgi:Flp pilus assembly protein TadD
MLAFDNALAVATLTRALAISPNSVNARGLLGIAHAFGGRSVKALACIDHAVRLSPRDTFLSNFELYYAFAHFQGARYESRAAVCPAGASYAAGPSVSHVGLVYWAG